MCWKVLQDWCNFSELRHVFWHPSRHCNYGHAAEGSGVTICCTRGSFLNFLNSNTADWCKEMCLERDNFLIYYKFLQLKNKSPKNLELKSVPCAQWKRPSVINLPVLNLTINFYLHNFIKIVKLAKQIVYVVCFMCDKEKKKWFLLVMQNYVLESHLFCAPPWHMDTELLRGTAMDWSATIWIFPPDFRQNFRYCVILCLPSEHSWTWWGFMLSYRVKNGCQLVLSPGNGESQKWSQKCGLKTSLIWPDKRNIFNCSALVGK